MKYESNPKHKEPWHHGRSGTFCPRWSWSHAQAILEGSVPSPNGEHRYGVLDGMAFKGHQHDLDIWHGHPVAWNEVPQKIVNQWLREGKVKRRDIAKLKHPFDLDEFLERERD